MSESSRPVFNVFRLERRSDYKPPPPRMRWEKISVVGAVLALAAVLLVAPRIPHRAPSERLTEAQSGTYQLCNTVATYAREQRALGVRGAELLPASTPRTPGVLPAREAVTVERSAWQEPAWRALGFEILGPHHFAYSWTRRGDAGVVTALGDPDGDGRTTLVERTVTLTDEGEARCGDASVRGDEL